MSNNTVNGATNSTEARLASVPMLRTTVDIKQIEKHAVSELIQGDDIYHFIESACRQTPDRQAIIAIEDASLETEAIEISFRTVLENITRAANLFHKAGANRNNAVSLLLPISPETEYAMWGAATASIVNPINPFLEIEHLAGILNAANTKVLVAAGADLDPDTAKKAETLRSLVPGLTHIYYTGRPPTPGGLSFGDALAQQDGARLQFNREPALENVAAYFHTGGTTGTPKLAKHTHLGQILNAFLVGLVNGNDPSHTVAHGMPMFHVGGAVVSSLRSLILGQTCVQLTSQGFRNPACIQNYWSIVEKYQVSSGMAVPTICAALLNNTDAPATKTSLQFLATGASTVPEELSLAFVEKFGVPMRELWGMTELHGVATSNLGFGEPTTGSAGVSLPFQRLKVIEHEDGRFVRECDTNQSGLIVFNGPTVIKEYVDPGHTSAGFISEMPDGEPWLNTGDLGRVDEKGYVWIIGRMKDLIIRGGHNIDPVIIEDALLAHDAVALAAAVGRPDGLKGEMPVAYVQLKPGAQAGAADIRSFAADRIPERAAIPEEVFVVDEIPVTAVGKIFKPALRTDITVKTVNTMIADMNVAGVSSDVSARFDKSIGLVVETKLTGKADGCRALKEQLSNTLASYPLKAIINVIE